MTEVTVSWGRDNRRSVTTPTELDAVLDEVEQLRGDCDLPYAVNVHQNNRDLPAVQLGVGYSDRAFLLRIQPGGDYDIDPTLPELDDVLEWDYGGQATEVPPEWTRVTPAAAREAAREYVRTAHMQHA